MFFLLLLKEKFTMRSRIIKQAITTDSLFKTLSQWCQEGAGQKTHSIKILTAFVSGKGVEALSPFFDIFLADGNDIQVIFGVDRGGTDKEAIKRLYSLQNAHIQQFTASYLRARASGSIFHPKLYIYELGNQIKYVIGSANLTLGGLGSNLESLIIFDDLDKNAALARQALEIWNSFAQPSPPLPTNCLNQLTAEIVRSLQEELPDRSTNDRESGSRDIRNLWDPLSRVPLPRSGVPVRSGRRIPAQGLGRYLLMDVLQETRLTQLQIPLAIVEGFFGVGRRQSATIKVSIISDGEITHPIERPIVISGLKYFRLMRRLEMPQIRKLRRPLAVVFIKLPGPRNFAYRLIRRDSEQYGIVSDILNHAGQQGKAERRYYIGRRDDRHWEAISELLGLE
jgi:HKD family nuclease